MIVLCSISLLCAVRFLNFYEFVPHGECACVLCALRVFYLCVCVMFYLCVIYVYHMLVFFVSVRFSCVCVECEA